jgi:hypothetical protein
VGDRKEDPGCAPCTGVFPQSLTARKKQLLKFDKLRLAYPGSHQLFEIHQIGIERELCDQDNRSQYNDDDKNPVDDIHEKRSLHFGFFTLHLHQTTSLFRLWEPGVNNLCISDSSSDLEEKKNPSGFFDL